MPSPNPYRVHRQQDIPVTPEVMAWEASYRLPAITGTPRQIAWARLVRHQFLAPVFSTLMEATKDLTDPTPVYNSLDIIRATTDSRAWLNDLKPHIRKSMAYMLGR